MSKIPEGATHKIQLIGGAVGYRRKVIRGWEGYVDGDWVLLCGGMPYIYEPIQAEPKWTGEGLPPEGVTCEVKGCMSHYLQWNKVTVFAVRGKTVFFDMEDGRWGQTDSHEFRTVRTPEQIAEEELEIQQRKQAIDKIQEIYELAMSSTRRGHASRPAIEALYDQGLRFVEVTK